MAGVDQDKTFTDGLGNPIRKGGVGIVNFENGSWPYHKDGIPLPQSDTSTTESRHRFGDSREISNDQSRGTRN